MRIIGGLWRRHKLLVPAGHDIRPTSDRTSESLFNILENSSLEDNARIRFKILSNETSSYFPDLLITLILDKVDN